MKRLFFALVGVVALVPLSARADDVPPKTFTVPFDLIKTQHMVVNVKINGKGPYRLIFDTGAPDSLVSNKVAKEAGLFTKDTKRPALALFGSMGQFKMKSLEAGNLKAENLSVMVIDHPTVGALASAVGPIEGIVGFTFFARYRMTIDYEKKEMTFTPVAYDPPDTMQAMMKKLLAPRSEREKPAILAPGGLFGLKVDRAITDETPGVTITEVLPETPAAAAGLKAGDVLASLDGRWTTSVADTYAAAAAVAPGQAVPVVVLRDGRERTLTVRPASGF
jgi:membrane-associated protease RseP (regulator of RpoE activity)